MTPELVSLICARDRLKRKAVKQRDNNVWEQYKRTHNQVVHAIKQAHRSYYSDQVNTYSGDKTATVYGRH